MEVKSRDLDGRLYLAMRCAQAGHPVLLGIRSRVKRFVRKDLAGPVHYISKGNRPEESIYNKIKSLGGSLYLLDEEGAGNLSHNIHVNHPFVLTQDHVERVFVWGDRQKAYFIKNGAVPEKLLVTGNPRFDLCKPERVIFYQELSKRLNKPDKYILVASNMAWGNQALGKEGYKKQYKEILEGRHGAPVFDEKEYDYHYEVCHERLLKMIKLTKKIAAAYPNISVVYRPHPAENIDFYNNKFTEDNILLTREGSSLEWIVDEIAHVHVDCTTGIEAFMMGKEVISYIPTENMDFLTDLPLTASTVCKTEKCVLDKIQCGIENQGNSSILEETKKEKITDLQSVIANFSLDSCTQILSAFPDHAPHPPLVPKSFLYRTAKKIRKHLRKGRLSDQEKGTLGKFPGLDIAEVKRKVTALQHMDETLPRVKVREYDIDTFLIEPYEA